jgi:hypothetical protein
MIFYLIPATADKPATLAPTQAEANTEAKARGLKVRAPDMQHDVPTSKPDLMAYINAMLVTQRNLHADVEAATETPAVEAPPPVEEAGPRQRLLTSGNEADEIEGFILERASVAQVEQIMARLGTRFAELVKGVKS